MSSTKTVDRGWARVWRIAKEWRPEIVTVLLLGAAFAVTPNQTLLVIYKAAKPMLGAVLGYWSFEFLVARPPDYADTHDRYQVIALMCAGMVAMGGAG